ncbi:hypothetical protein E3N88_43650 [Mikania micrantha]|uniref:Ty3 transposon capsid-like protein domain-containing protein n=1 Tax=Mikania micrantha TaxID=192012 RepID=A0A5N6LEG1_9ASTR|nr:hypothetical protein E3N88_43650 [Mikania micrantha]
MYVICCIGIRTGIVNCKKRSTTICRRTDLEKTIDEHALKLLKADAFMQRSEQTFANLNGNSFLKTKGVLVTNISWKIYLEAIVARFSTTLFEDAMGMLTSLSQTGLLEEFCQEFDACLLKVSIPKPYAVSIFLKAVNPAIGGRVKMFQPKTLREAFYQAKIQDAKRDP